MDFAGFLIGHGHSDMFLLAFNGERFYAWFSTIFALGYLEAQW